MQERTPIWRRRVTQRGSVSARVRSTLLPGRDPGLRQPRDDTHLEQAGLLAEGNAKQIHGNTIRVSCLRNLLGSDASATPRGVRLTWDRIPGVPLRFTPGCNPSRHWRLKLRADSFYQPTPGAAPMYVSSVNCFSMKSATSERAVLTGQR